MGTKSREKKLYEGGFQNYSKKLGAMKRYPYGGKFLTIFCRMMSNITIKLWCMCIPFHHMHVPVKMLFPAIVL